MHIARVFRLFLVGDALLTATSIAIGVFGTDNASDQSSESLVHIVIASAVLLAWVIALAGLWRFRNWARVLYLTVAGVGLVGSFLLAGEVTTGIDALLNAACWAVTGVILALMYWSPVASSFRTIQRAA